MLSDKLIIARPMLEQIVFINCVFIYFRFLVSIQDISFSRAIFHPVCLHRKALHLSSHILFHGSYVYRPMDFYLELLVEQ